MTRFGYRKPDIGEGLVGRVYPAFRIDEDGEIVEEGFGRLTRGGVAFRPRAGGGKAGVGAFADQICFELGKGSEDRRSAVHLRGVVDRLAEAAQTDVSPLKLFADGYKVAQRPRVGTVAAGTQRVLSPRAARQRGQCWRKTAQFCPHCRAAGERPDSAQRHRPAQARMPGAADGPCRALLPSPAAFAPWQAVRRATNRRCI